MRYSPYLILCVCQRGSLAVVAKSGLPRAEKRARTRAALLDAAAELFAARGFRHVSVDEIAERAGLTKGAVYDHFEDKEALFAETCLSRSTSVDTGVLADDSLTFEEQLRALWLAVADATLSEENAALTPLELEMTQLSMSSERARQWVATAYAFNRRGMASLIERAIQRENESLPPLPPEELATIVRATMHGLMQQRRADPDAVPPSYFEHAASLLLGNPNPLEPRRRGE